MKEAPYGRGPERKHTIILKAGGDTLRDLASELRALADRLDRDELTVGTSGGPSCGSTYSYRVNPHQTHEQYFLEIEDWLESERQAQIDEANNLT